MNAILAIPFGVRLAGLFLLGMSVAALVNWAVYNLAWQPRPISPWGKSPPAGGRTWPDRVPLLGWWRLRRESHLHGRGFWIRPLALEVCLGLAYAGLYAWEAGALGLYGTVHAGPPPGGALVCAEFEAVVHWQFFSHLVLLSLMFVASLIDLDELTIPDSLTIPGTLAGLALATIWPWSLLPAKMWLVDQVRAVEFLSLASPEPWPDWLDGFPLAWGMAIAAWTLWCVAILPRRWNVRRGYKTAVRVFFHRLLVERATYRIAFMWLAGGAVITAVAHSAPMAAWAGLLSALVGMALGGGLIWIVRIIGTAALGREAMGFGDVTLMAMIGTYVGWQGALVVFFLAPCLGLASGLVRWTLHREHELPYGPYLCLATVLLVVRWSGIWESGNELFALGWLLLAVLAACFVLMALLLTIYAQARRAWQRR